MTAKQLKLAAEHGTSLEFKSAAIRAINAGMITIKEAMDGIEKYQKEWEEAGTESKDVIVVLNARNEPKYVFMSNEDKDIGLRDAGIDSNMFKRLGFRTVTGKVTFSI